MNNNIDNGTNNYKDSVQNLLSSINIKHSLLFPKILRKNLWYICLIIFVVLGGNVNIIDVGLLDTTIRWKGENLLTLGNIHSSIISTYPNLN